MVGILIATIGILVLVVGVIGASIEVYAQLTLGLLQQRLSGVVQEQLPRILQQGEAPAAEEQGAYFGPTDVLTGLIENLISSPLWLILTLVGIGLVYLGLYLTQRQAAGRRT